MNKTFRIALGSAVLAGVLAFATASPASAQVRIRGSFPVPHGRISISVGDPFFPVGSYVPYGYDVLEDPDYGYGFYYEDAWIPCEQYADRWIVVERPAYSGFHDYRYQDYGYQNYGYRDYGYVSPHRYDRYGYSRRYGRDDYRRYRRHDRRWRDDRWSRDRRDRDWDRR
jgi:hypothetical protein